MIRWEVDEEFHNLRLDQFLMKYLETWSREQVKKKIKGGGIHIQGRPEGHRPNTKVHWKDIVTMITKREELLRFEQEYWKGKKIPMEDPKILYQDDALLVISKPPYMSTHPTGRHIFHCATVYYEEKLDHPVHSIHRLDRETSGVLLLGKTPTSSQTLTQNFEANRVSKCYFFIAKKQHFKEKEAFRATERMGPKETGLRKVIHYAFPEDSNEGKSAQTDFKILYQEKGYALGLAFPKTGRQHQIRVHAAHHGLPLLGDKLYLGGYPMFQRFKDHYAGEEDFAWVELPRQALHNAGLAFPYEGENKFFFAPLPHDFESWIRENLSIDPKEINDRMKKTIEERFALKSKST